LIREIVGLISALKALVSRWVFRNPARVVMHSLLALVLALITAMHPYFVGVTEVNIDPKSRHIDVSCKLFVDDVQDVIFQQTGQKINLTVKSPQNLALLKNYLISHVKVKWGNNYLPLLMLGYDIEEEGVWCYLETTFKSRTQSITICNRALYETIETQTHFLHVNYGAVKQHWKITNPEACHTFTLR